MQSEQQELPLSSLEPLFPHAPATPSALAEHYIGKLRELLRTPVHRSPGATLWDVQFWPKDRRFLLRIAELPPELARCTWFQLEPMQQARIVATFSKLREWVNKFTPPIEPPEAPR